MRVYTAADLVFLEKRVRRTRYLLDILDHICVLVRGCANWHHLIFRARLQNSGSTIIGYENDVSDGFNGGFGAL